jgi:hypothetical protein
MRHKSFWISVIASLTACATPEDQPADSVPVTSVPDFVDTASAAPTSTTPDSQSVVTEFGLGKLRAGMTVAEASSVFPGFKIPVRRNRNACVYATADSLPSGVRVMVEQGKVVRVEVAEGPVKTAKGARIGDTEERIKRLYPNQVTVSPHKYTDGHYLTVVPTANADSAYRIVFETDGRRVLRYRAGTRPQVEYVEGCG